MQTVILAAGEGTRMRPLTADIPKPMLPVADRPILGHTIEAAISAGASELVLVVGYEAERIREYVGDRVGDVPVTFTVQEHRRGTAHAVNKATESLDSGPFAVLNGDSLYDPGSLSTLFESGPGVGSYEAENPSEYGVLELDDGHVARVIEKPFDPPSNLVNTGAYVFPHEAKSWLDVEKSARGELELTDVLERTSKAFDVEAVPVDRWLDVGRPWELLAANEWKLEELDRSIEGQVHQSAELVGDIVVEEGATVRAGVVIEGPALVRSGATVGPNAYLRGSSLLCEDVHVGHAVEVKNSVILPGTNVAHLSYVGDSVLGQDVNFGAGTTVANLRHDDEPVTMRIKGEVVSTGRRKFGVVAGPGAQTGINTSLNAGVKLPADSHTKPGETVLRDPGG